MSPMATHAIELPVRLMTELPLGSECLRIDEGLVAEQGSHEKFH
jgi:hypothetical protein